MTSDEKIEKYVDLVLETRKAHGRHFYWCRRIDELKEEREKLLDEMEYVDFLKANVILEEISNKKGEKND